MEIYFEAKNYIWSDTYFLEKRKTRPTNLLLVGLVEKLSSFEQSSSVGSFFSFLLQKEGEAAASLGCGKEECVRCLLSLFVLVLVRTGIRAFIP